jgi:hypothetical protein
MLKLGLPIQVYELLESLSTSYNEVNNSLSLSQIYSYIPPSFQHTKCHKHQSFECLPEPADHLSPITKHHTQQDPLTLYVPHHIFVQPSGGLYQPMKIVFIFRYPLISQLPMSLTISRIIRYKGHIMCVFYLVLKSIE